MELLYALENLRTPFFNTLMGLITQLGGEAAFMAVALILFWCVDKSQGYYMLTVGFAGTVLNQALKLIFRIPRPWVRDPDFSIVESARAGATGYSFPSGHTQNAVTLFGCLGRTAKRRLWRILCVVVIGLVAVSRMYLGVHTPLDVGVSLALGAALVLGLYPLFRAVERRPSRMYAVLGAMLAVCAGYLAFVYLWPFPADIDLDNLAEGVASGWKLLGAVGGMLAAFWLDRTRIHFDTRAPLAAQILKTALGLTLLIGLKALLKQPLLNLCGGPWAHAVRYLLVVFFAAGLWPMTFPWFARLAGPTKKEENHEQS